jgi:type 1 glutamine amidotransferase
MWNSGSGSAKLVPSERDPGFDVRSIAMCHSCFFLVAYLISLLAAVSCSSGTSGEVGEQFFQQDSIRALILSGRNNHDWRSTTRFLRHILEQAGVFDVRVTEEPAGLSAESLAPYHVLVLDYMGPRWGQTTEKAVEKFVASGKGLVVVHGASYAFGGLEVLADNHRRTGIKELPWNEYRNMIGGVWSEEDPTTAHGDLHSFMVSFVNRDHPITSGMGRGFIATDELYHNLDMQPGVDVLATAYSAPETRGTGEDEPVLWTTAYGSGRVFHTTLGHDLTAMSEPGFVATFARGCEWAARGRVTLPTSIDLTNKGGTPVRVLVVTGGHSYDTEFYSLFDQDSLTWDHIPNNQEAFAEDICSGYDVLVLYDLSRELDENGKRNLRAFVESDKGLLVLHHALADYNSWEWWWREVVGGKYTLDGENASSAKHGIGLFVQTVGKHPITLGLGPMHFVDETYKDLWISEEVELILRVEEQTSDGPVAWISPYEKSRVVCIQLGHDRNAFVNPGFRKLIERAILWSCDRLER